MLNCNYRAKHYSALLGFLAHHDGLRNPPAAQLWPAIPPPLPEFPPFTRVAAPPAAPPAAPLAAPPAAPLAPEGSQLRSYAGRTVSDQWMRTTMEVM